MSETFDRLLAEMREGRLDLASLPLALLLDALSAALHGDGALTDKAGWIVTVAAMLERRSRLLLPREAMAPQGPDAAETERLRAQPAGLAESRALALWLGARPQLGQDIFSRGGADTPGGEEDMALDVIEFLWASIAVFEGFLHEAIPLYQPAPAVLHGITEARARILQRLAEAPAGLDLPALLPSEAGEALRRRSAWSSTFAAGLELAKGGAVILDQTTPQGLPLMRRSDV